MAANPEQRPHPCTWADCERSFARKSDLARHMRIHLNERPFACEEPGCGKAFIQRSALTVHMRVHTGEKPHCCAQCGRAFADSSSLARHRRVHTGARPYLCQVRGCARSFCRKTTLIKHEYKVHGIMPPPSPSPTSGSFPRDLFNSAPDYNSEPDMPEVKYETSAAMEADELDFEEEEEDEPELEDDDDYKPTANTKKASSGSNTRRPPPKKPTGKAMSARYNPGTNVTLPPARPHPGLAPAQPFDPYIPPSQQQQQQQHFMHMSQGIQSEPNTPMGHRPPQFSPVDVYQHHPHTATLPPLANAPSSAASYYPTLPPMNLSPARSHPPQDNMGYYPGVTVTSSPPPSYGEYAHHSQQSQPYTVSPQLQHPQPPPMTRHHSFSGPFYNSPHQQPMQQLPPTDQRQEQVPRTAEPRRLSLPGHDDAPPPSQGPTLSGYHEADPTFSPSSSMSSGRGHPPEPAYALHPGSPSVSPPNGYLSPHFSIVSHYMPTSVLQQEMHHHHQHYAPQPRMVYVGDVHGHLQEQ